VGIRVVIPVAGAGTRLRPHTHTRPKVLIHVAGKPMLGHILDELRPYEIEEVTLIIGHLGEEIRRYVTEGFPFRFRFIWQEEAKGLGHAIWLSEPGYRRGGPVLIVLGDTLFEADFGRIVGGEANWIGVKEVDDPRRFGVVVLENGRIRAMVEKPKEPPSHLAIVGIYAFKEPSLLYECLDEIVEQEVRTAGEIQLTDALQRMLDRGADMRPFFIDAWHDCGKPETLLATNRALLGRLAEQGRLPVAGPFPGCVIIPPVAIERDVELSHSIVGPHVTLGAGSRIRDSIIRDSIISGSARVERAHLEGSIIADNAAVVGRARRLNLGDASEVELA